jgi:hypothetical protein
MLASPNLSSAKSPDTFTVVAREGAIDAIIRVSERLAGVLINRPHCDTKDIRTKVSFMNAAYVSSANRPCGKHRKTSFVSSVVFVLPVVSSLALMTAGEERKRLIR